MRRSFSKNSSQSNTSLSNKDECHLYGHLVEKCKEPPKTPAVSLASHLSSISEKPAKPPLKSLLVTGFGIRNADSLQRALLDDEQRRQMLLFQHQRDDGEECLSVSSRRSSTSTARTKFTEGASQSISSSTERYISLQYLMGLTMEEEGEGGEPREVPCSYPEMGGEEEEKLHPRITLAMRKAQKYMRSHHIFEFFQFLTAHLLSALADDPIQFLLDLLDRCLLYRTGLGLPPLLFEKPHLEQLFYLMDRMKTGFIELEQYKTGMITLGICSFERNPPLSSDGMVSRDTFIEEAYECLTDLFHDMIRRRGDKSTATAPSIVPPPPTEVSVFSMIGQ